MEWTDERAPLARAAPGVTPVNKLETKSSVVGRQEPINCVKSLKYATQTTASVWMPFKQMYKGESGDAVFDTFEMAPWDAGRIQGEKLHNVMYRPVTVNRRTTRKKGK